MGEGNGKELTTEERAALEATLETERVIARRKKFEESPEEFIHLSEIVIGTRLLPDGGLQCVIGVGEQLAIEASLSKIQYEGMKVLSLIERSKQPKVKAVKGGIMGFVRGMR